MQVLLQLMSAVAMLTWGIYITKSGVLRTSSAAINKFVAKSLKSRLWPLRAIAAGFVTTALVQSSNATAMLVASFLKKGLFTLTSALTIMLGADLGSAVMARILTFDLSFLSPLFLIVGIFLFMSRRKSKAGQIGRIFIGLGIILMALKAIVASTSPLVQSEVVALILDSLDEQMALALIFGALLAILCYSSLAAVILTAVTAAHGHLDFATALTLVVGANLGSCCLEIIGALGQGLTAKRVMFGNTFFKLTIAVLVLPVIPMLPSDLVALPLTDQIIWFHVLFNAAVCVLLTPAVGLYGRLLCRLFPEVEVDHDESKSLYLDEEVLDNPQLALSNTVRETLRLGGFLHEMLAYFTDALTGKTSLKESLDRKLYVMECVGANVRLYLEGIQTDDDPGLKSRWHQILSAVTASTHAGDLIRRMQNEVQSVNKSQEVSISAHSRADLIKLSKIVNENLSLALNAFMSSDPKDLELVFTHKTEFKSLTDKYSVRELNKILPEVSSENEGRALVLMLISDLRQLNGIICAIASSRWAQINLSRDKAGKEQTLVTED